MLLLIVCLDCAYTDISYEIKVHFQGQIYAFSINLNLTLGGGPLGEERLLTVHTLW